MGSFENPDNARAAADAAEAALGDSFNASRTEAGDRIVYRVLSDVYATREAAQGAVTLARQADFADAWIITSDRSVLPPTNTSNNNPKAPAPAAPMSASAVDAKTSIAKATIAGVDNIVALNGAKAAPVYLEAESANSADSTEEALLLRKATEAEAQITIDGQMNERIWSTLPDVSKLVVLDPDTLADVPHESRIKFVYTDKGLYVGADLDQPKDTLIRRLSGRDIFFGLNRDSINLTLDTSGQGLYGFWFGINLGDSLMDGTILPESRYSREWDGPWRGASTETETGWSAEFFIPWSAVSMPSAPDVRDMGVFISRKVAYLDERWGWPALPPTQPKFLSVLQPVQLQGVSPRQQYNVYPFASVTQDNIDEETRYQLGADLFWRPSSNFQLNATLNPDFGNVESDDVVVNLSATETFFPEKRLFFVEGQEIFVASPRADIRGGGVGNTGAPTTLVNTRRIGGRPQPPALSSGQSVTNRELGLPAELLGAAKGTGQIGNFRYGLMTAFEDEALFNGTENGRPVHITQDGSDYGVARLLYENNDNGYKAVGLLSTAVKHFDGDAYVTGMDWHLLTQSGKFRADGQVFRSDVDGYQAGYGGFLDFEYTFRQGVKQRLGIEYFDEHVNINDLGFQARNNYRQIRSAHSRTISNLSWARDNEFDVRGFLQQNGDGYFSRGGMALANRTTFKNLTSLTMRLEHYLPRYDDLNGFGNGIFRTEENSAVSFEFESNSTKALSFALGTGYFEEDLGGDSYYYDAYVNWRPLDGLNLSAGLEYFDSDGWLLHQESRNMTTFSAKGLTPNLNLEYFLNAKQQFKVSVQWVGIEAVEDEFFLIPNTPGRLINVLKSGAADDSFAISDIVFQARYRWEIAPLSDLFIVYVRASDIAQPLRKDNFSDLLDKAWANPINDQLVVKVRYRFGS